MQDNTCIIVEIAVFHNTCVTLNICGIAKISQKVLLHIGQVSLGKLKDKYAFRNRRRKLTRYKPDRDLMRGKGSFP